MKLSMLLLTIGFYNLTASVYSQSVKLNLTQQNVTLKEIFASIEKETSYKFLYRSDLVNMNSLMSINEKGSSLENVLDKLLEGTNIKYSILDNNLVVLTPNANVAQAIVIKGTVSDKDGNPLPGVNIIVKGTTKGVVSDLDGNYSIDVPSAESVLVFSFVGYNAEEVVVGDQRTINMKLIEDVKQLNEVVVTALGIKRDKKTLTYSSQQVSGDELMKAKDLNFMSSLSGKTAGLEIKKSTTGAGGSTRTVLRGNRSVTSLSEPLYVIDGIPMVNNKGGQPGMWGGNDEGDGLSQINPEDIESVNVLKGSNAAVLYGSQGANGVIIITTKKGKEGKASVNISSSTMFESAMLLPELQFKYGSVSGAKESWSYDAGNYDSNYVKDFFRTGHNLVNSVSVSGGNSMTTAYFSYANTTATGIVPNNNYRKDNVSFNQSTKLFNDKLLIRSNVMLTSEKTNNRTSPGYYLNPLTGLYLFPRDRDFESYKENYKVWSTDRNMWLQNWHVADHMQSNPYWIINKEPKVDLVKRVIASAGLEYSITSKLKFQARASYDYAVKSHDERHFAGSNTVNCSTNGRWVYKKYYDQQLYTDGILTYNNNFGDFSLNALAGATYQESILGDGVSVDNGTNKLLYPNEFFFQNLPTNVQVKSIYGGHIIKEGVFANAQIGYKEMLFLDLSGRNDWASTLYGTGNESYFYPSAGLTGIISQMVDLPEFVTFGKARVSLSKVANEVPFNTINPQNTVNGSNQIVATDVMPFTNLKPEMLTSTEVGTEWKFFDGRFGFDFTYYNIISKNQFIKMTAPASSDYSYYYINAGKIVNKGIELVIDAEPIRNSKGLGWKTTFNFDHNKNKVEELIAGQSDKTIDLGSSEGYYSYVKAGGSVNDLYGYKFVRNSAGQIVLDATSGKPTKSSAPEYIGNLDPKWSLGWNNTITYKNAYLSFLVNGKFGGKCVSQTESILDGYGVSQRTADARDNGGVNVNAIQGTTAVTSIDPKLYYTTVGDRNGILEPYVYDRTNVRLSQLSIGYDFNLAKYGTMFKSLSVSLVGQNLLFFYKKAPFDPELAISTSLGSQSLDNFNLPATRTYGFNIKLNL